MHTFLFRSIVNDIFIHSSLLFFMGGCRICRGRSRDDCSLHFLHPVVSLQLYRSAIVRVFSGNNKRARPNLLSNRASSFVLNFVLNPCFPCNTPPFRLIINGLLSYFSVDDNGRNLVKLRDKDYLCKRSICIFLISS